MRGTPPRAIPKGKGGAMRRTLVTYATKKGSTREVAEALGLRLEGHGLSTTLLPAAEIDELDDFDAVVVGGALYTGRWHADARRFLKEFREPLAGMQLAVFAIGPLTTSEEDVAGARKQLDRALAKTPELEPVSVAIFGGAVVPDKLHFPFSRMPASDARDWDEIRAWADTLAELIDVEAHAPA